MNAASRNFALTLVRAARWDESCGIREQEGWDDHAAFMDALVDDGFVLHGGPVGDGRQTLHLVEAPDEAAVRARLAEDPWALAQLLSVGSIEPWELWLDARAHSTRAAVVES